jgi:hypothetical protein
MSNQDKNVLRYALNDATSKFVSEYKAFLATQSYLLEVNVAALKKISPIDDVHKVCAEHLMPEYESPYIYICSRLYISLIASFELLIQDYLVAVITAHPKKVGQIEFKLSEILDSSEKNELTQRAIQETLNKIMYEKPLDYLTKISSLLSINEISLKPLWQTFIEAKARRDLGLHNGWKCNAIYLRKISEAGLTAKFIQGESTLPKVKEYITPVGRALSELAEMLHKEITAKHL